MAKDKLRQIIRKEIKNIIGESKVTNAYYNILKDTGWATDSYIVDVYSFWNHLTNEETYELLIMLAKSGKLYDELKVGIESGDFPSKGKMTVGQVRMRFWDLNGDS